MPPITALENLTPEKMTALIQEALPPGHLALLHLVADEALARGLSLFIIGGFVRDLFVGNPGLDFDLVVEGDAVALASAIASKYGGRITVHSHFGTASWYPDLDELTKLKKGSFERRDMPPLDFVSARSEIYPHPGALPIVKRGTLKDDLQRRDFTINTLALRLDGAYFGQLVDQSGGLADLKKGRVRVLHRDSYVDDPTRILRAIRYEKRYEFEIAPGDLELIEVAKSHLSGLSGERLRHELDLILAEDKSTSMLTRLNELDILNKIHPFLAWDASRAGWLEKLKPPEPDSWKGATDLLHIPHRVGLSYLVWLGHLGQTEIEELASRLDFAASLREALLSLSFLYPDLHDLVSARRSEVVARLDGLPLLAICAASVSAGDRVRLILEDYLARWRHIKPKTTGDQLIARGLPPGPAYKIILDSLRTAWLDGELKTEEEEMELLEKLIKQVQTS